jgi:hypothetical protein
MIRNLMLAVGLFSLTGASAMAAPVRHVAPTHKVAKADEPAPAEAGKEPKKATSKKSSHKKDKKAKEGEAAAPATPAPAPAK